MVVICLILLVSLYVSPEVEKEKLGEEGELPSLIREGEISIEAETCGDGICAISEVGTCADCVNLVLNPGFDEGMNSWTPYKKSGENNGIKEIVQDGENNVLFINNSPEGNDIGVKQSFTFDSPVSNPVYIKYKIKPLEFSEGALVSLDLYVLHPDGTLDMITAPFKATSSDVGKWVEKEHIYLSSNPISGFTIYLLNYYGNSSAYYDNISLALLEDGVYFEVSNSNTALKFSSYGLITSLNSNGNELLTDLSKPFSEIYLDDGSSFVSNKIMKLDGNKYLIGYTSTNAEIELDIIPNDSYFLLNVTAVRNLPENTAKLYILKLFPDIVAQHSSNAEWAKNAPQGQIFIDTFPASVNTICKRESKYYECYASKFLGLENISVALMVTQKSEYYNVLEKIILETGSPYVIYDDGKWIWDSDRPRRSYLFATVTKENYEKIGNYMATGNFVDLLLLGPFKYGRGNQPRSFSSSTEEFLSAMNELLSKGIKLGVHSFFFQVEYSEGMIDFGTPSIPLKEALSTVGIGQLAKNIGASDSQIEANTILSESENFSFYFVPTEAYSRYSRLFLIGNEIIECKSNDGTQLTNCARGMFSTTKSAHPVGDDIFILPTYTPGSFHFNPENEEITNLAINSFVDMAKKLNMTMVYEDGWLFHSFPGMSGDEYNAYIYKIANSRYLDALIKNLDFAPLIQGVGGSTSSLYNTYYAPRIATMDAPVFKPKIFTKDRKIESLLTSNPYNPPRPELGWWQFHEAIFSNGINDIDATDYDDVHYVMTKMIAHKTSLGLQLGFGYEDHKKLLNLFELAGLYNKLNEEDIQNNIVPDSVRKYLQEKDNEAELNKVSGYNFVEKTINKSYLNWNSGAASINYYNPFGAQGANIYLRPKFDYKGFNDPSNELLVDFSEVSPVISTSDSTVLCTYNQGSISISNTGTRVGGCILTIDKSFDLKNKRGLGVSITGDNKNELVVIGIGSSQYGARDYKFLVDFSGKKELLLGDPTGDIKDYVGEEYAGWFYYRELKRNWKYNYSDNSKIKIFISNVKPGETAFLQIPNIKGLAEKTGSLNNPKINVNGKEIVFPISLFIDDTHSYLLEYNGNNGAYKLYDPNYGFISEGVTETSQLKQGTNTISVSSDSGVDNLQRGELVVWTYDDEDGDLIPTNGNYDSSYYACDGTNNFCDDNCPDVFNPDQKDSDNNGIGDACGEVPCTTCDGGGGGGGGCTAEPKNITCLNTECGAKKNNCNYTIDCGNCTTGFNCVDGRCINLTSCSPESKEATCRDWSCGIKNNNCGETIVCGECQENETCENGKCEAKELPKPSEIIKLIKEFIVKYKFYFASGVLIVLIGGTSIIIFSKLTRKKKISSIGEKVHIEGRIREAKNLILEARRKGYSESFIKKLFLDKGWNEKLIDRLIKEVGVVIKIKKACIYKRYTTI